MNRFKKIPILNDFTPRGLLIIGLIALGGIIVLAGIVAVIMILV